MYDVYINFFYRQEAFIEDYFLSQRDDIFKNVEVLIYVFNIKSRDEELKKDYEYYQTCLSAIHENSPSAQVFCLLHKIDLLRDDQKNKVGYIYSNCEYKNIIYSNHLQ